MSALTDLAREAGLQPEWEDAASQPQVVSEESLKLVLGALGLPAEDASDIAASRDKVRALRERGAERFITARIGEPIYLPGSLGGLARLHLENGPARDVDLSRHRLEAIEEPGYHRLVHGAGETIIAVAPTRCFGIRDIAPAGRIWGAAAQLPSLRGSRAAPFGDFGTLREAARALGRKGADLLAISPVHALFPADAGRFSPYGPSSRRFLNTAFADLSLAGAEPAPGSTQGDLIDWQDALPRRMAELRAAFDALAPEERQRLARIDRLPEGEQLDHALYDAIHAHFAAQGAHGWQAWPAAFHDPESAEVRDFAQAHRDDVGFYAWLQGLADKSLAGAQGAALQAGMACGIVTDLAVGIDPGGSDAWTRPGAFLSGLSVGAPPDLLGPDGQDWGLTTFNPLTLHADRFRAFRETLSAAMANAGGVRIDHVLGLRRIWAVPHGHPSSAGCYISMPQADLTNVLALESWRNRAIVIGEDLGTVPDGLRDEMDEAAVSGMRVLWFERDREGDFTDPATWDRQAAAMTSTHDLPTLAGWWQGRDIDWTWRIGRKSRFETPEEEEADRGRERERIWNRIVASGHGEGPPPDAAEFVTAAIAHVADSACELALIPLEDLFGVVEQPNLPGTIDEHPNWRRRLPAGVGDLLEGPEVADRLAALGRTRRA